MLTEEKLEEIEGELDQLRAKRCVRARELEALAKRLGRELYNRGKEPTWVSEAFPKLRPLSIPRHGDRDLRIGTKNSICDQLSEDVEAWRNFLGTSAR